MRIVLDTNVAVSALIWGGTPDKLMQMAIDGDVELCTSAELLDELLQVLLRQHLVSSLGSRHASVQDAINIHGELAIEVSPTSVPHVVLADADDDHVIAAAMAGGADLIVSGDRHLLSLGSYRTVRIVTPAQAIRLIATARRLHVQLP